MMVKSVGVGKIKSYFALLHVYPKHSRDVRNQPRGKVSRSNQYCQRFAALELKHPHFWDSQNSDYGFGRLRGMLVHETLLKLVKTKFPNFHSFFPLPIDLVKFRVKLDEEMYRMLVEHYYELVPAYPLLEVYDESIIFEALGDLRSFLDHEFNKIVPRLDKGQKLKDILRGYAQLLQEKRQFITYRGVQIRFTPDWVNPLTEHVYVTDFKTGYKPENEQYNVEDVVQVLLYGWCLEKLLHKPITMELFYTKYNFAWDFDLPPDLYVLAQEIIDEYLIDHHLVEEGVYQRTLEFPRIRNKSHVQTKLRDFSGAGSI